jgi:hypothetical protein
MDTWLAEAPTVDIVWRRAADMSDVVLELTPHETRQLTAELAELLEKYQHRAQPPDGTEQVAVQYQVLPLLAGGATS